MLDARNAWRYPQYEMMRSCNSKEAEKTFRRAFSWKPHEHIQKDSTICGGSVSNGTLNALMPK
jgi:hypothetical protein